MLFTAGMRAFFPFCPTSNRLWCRLRYKGCPEIFRSTSGALPILGASGGRDEPSLLFSFIKSAYIALNLNSGVTALPPLSPSTLNSHANRGRLKRWKRLSQTDYGTVKKISGWQFWRRFHSCNSCIRKRHSLGRWIQAGISKLLLFARSAKFLLSGDSLGGSRSVLYISGNRDFRQYLSGQICRRSRHLQSLGIDFYLGRLSDSYRCHRRFYAPRVARENDRSPASKSRSKW